MIIRNHLQPMDATCGDLLRRYLTPPEALRFHGLTIVSAFAKTSGISRIWDELQLFGRDREIVSIIGIDHDGTSSDAVELLSHVSDELFVVHCSARSITFHPKLFVFEGEGVALVISGSSNLTAGGLWSNIEFLTETELTLPEDQEHFDAILRIVEELTDTAKDYVLHVNPGLLRRLLAILPSEQTIQRRTARGALSPAQATGTVAFGSGPQTRMPAPSRHIPPTSGMAGHVRQLAVRVPRRQQVLGMNGFWKKLSGFDVSASSAPGQIIIPKAFVDLFPRLSASRATTIGGQREVSFPVIFHGMGGSQLVLDARFIEYAPAPHHPRPNVEYRFTFRDPSINPSQLSEDDVLVFAVAQGGGVHFEVTHVPTNAPQYRRFRRIQSRYQRF
jgi:hypothetical protein